MSTQRRMDLSALSSLHLSRRTQLSALGLSAAGLGLAACGAPGGAGGAAAGESNLRSEFSQAAVNVPSEYSGRTNILFWAPFTGVNFEAVQALFAQFNESQGEIYAAAESQGETYVVPFARSTPLFYFNKTRFVELGLPETGPKTWDEFAELGPALMSVDVAGQPLRPMAFGAGDNWYGQAHAWAWGGAFSDGLSVTADSDPLREWLTWKAKFIHQDSFGYMAQSAMTDFQTGVAAACHGSTASLRGATEGSEFDIGTAFMLGKVEEETKVPTGGSGLSIVKAESQERQDACAELFRFLADPENSAFWHANTGYLPIVKASHETATVQDLVASNPNFGVALDQLRNAQTADEPTWYQSGTTEISTAMAKVYGDNADVDPTLTELQGALEEVIDDNREDLEEVLSA